MVENALIPEALCVFFSSHVKSIEVTCSDVLVGTSMLVVQDAIFQLSCDT